MKYYTLTPQQLADIIDDAFDLGKRYATDELNTLRPGFFAKTRTPIYKDGEETADDWTNFLDRNGGLGLDSQEAKLDILLKNLKDQMREELRKLTDFEG
jgi:hypothetical protein